MEGKRKRRPPTPLSQSDQWEFPAGSMTSPKRKKTKMMRRSKVVLSTPRANKRKCGYIGYVVSVVMVMMMMMILVARTMTV